MAVDLVPDLIRAGVRSFKIEGRLKGAEYVAITTKVLFSRHNFLSISLIFVPSMLLLFYHLNVSHHNIHSFVSRRTVRP